ncbi:MAG: cysteine desulfurase NifS [Clostridiales bacterium]|nr:cysteine desulfurase NifS [Clostridiales bacterium]
MRRVYLDHAATTGVDRDVLEKMTPYFSDTFGNPNSLHSFGREAEKAVTSSRDAIAKLLGCKPNELYFTSGGTEADNWAIKGIYTAYKNKGNHIITTKIEHKAVLASCQRLQKDGAEITYLDVDKYGTVDLEQLKNSITDKTILVSVITANNEVGTIQPIAEIGRICKERGVLFHTDAVQAIGAVDIDVKRDNIDLLSLSAHKVYGPKGIGALYIRNGVKCDRYISGGSQERGMRAGTTNVPLIVGMAAAFEKAVLNSEENNKKLIRLRDELIQRIEAGIPNSYLNGHRINRLPNNVNFCFEFVEGESLLLMLDMQGIAVSSGSACTSGSLEPSHVLSAMGVPPEIAQSATRFTFGRENTMEDIDYVVECLKKNLMTLRAMSPLFKQEKGDAKHV